MGRYAQIEDGLVVNVILWDGVEPYPDEDLLELDQGSPVGIGWRLDGDTWIAPPEPEDPLTPPEL